MDPRASVASAGRVVYYPFAPGEWCACQLLRYDDGGGAVVRYQRQDRAIEAGDVPSICPRDGEAFSQNLAALAADDVDIDKIERVVRHHVCSGLAYVDVGEATLFVNHFRPLSIYDAAWVDKYAALDPSLPPHIYSVAAKAYKRLQDAREDQAILLLGSTASGKSSAMGHVVDFMLQTAGDGGPLDSGLKALRDFLDPFVSLRTLDSKEYSSTRAAFSVDLVLDADGFLCSAGARLDNLEAGRLDRLEGAEGNTFDVFYLASKHASATKWFGALQEFRLLGDDTELAEFDAEGVKLRAWAEAAEHFGLDIGEVVRVLCGIVLLGELAVDDVGRGRWTASAKAAAAAFGVEPERLLALAGVAATLGAALEELYSRLVDHCVLMVNEKLKGESGSVGHTVRLIEVPAMLGDLDRAGGFDQVASQWLSEALQPHLTAAATRSPPAAPGAGDGALQALGGAGLIAALRELVADNTRTTESSLQAWLASAPATVAASPGRATISGSAEGAVEHRLDARLVRQAGGAGMPQDLARQLSASTQCRLLAALFGRPAPVRGVVAAQAALEHVESCLAGGRVRPWLVCCATSNQGLQPAVVSKPTLTRQLERFRVLETLRHMSRSRAAAEGSPFPLLDDAAADASPVSGDPKKRPRSPQDRKDRHRHLREQRLGSPTAHRRLKRGGAGDAAETRRDEEEAAIKIQSIHRGRAARRELEALQGQRGDGQANGQREEATPQKRHSTQSSRLARRLEEMRAEDDKSREEGRRREEEAAALRIQALQRGRSARRGLEETRSPAAAPAPAGPPRPWPPPEPRASADAGRPAERRVSQGSGRIEAARRAFQAGAGSQEMRPGAAVAETAWRASLRGSAGSPRTSQGAVEQHGGRAQVDGARSASPEPEAAPAPAPAPAPPAAPTTPAAPATPAAPEDEETQRRGLVEAARRASKRSAASAVAAALTAVAGGEPVPGGELSLRLDGEASPRQEVPRSPGAEQPRPPEPASSVASPKAPPPVSRRGSQDLGLAAFANPGARGLHSALAEMAAALRLCKEREDLYLDELEALRHESDSWRLESERLWCQVQDLRRQLRERG